MTPRTRTPPLAPPTLLRRVAVGVALWGAATLAGTAVMRGAWAGPGTTGDGSPAWAERWPVKPLANADTVVTFPAWIVVKGLTAHGPGSGLVYIAAANALGFGGIAAGVVLVLALRGAAVSCLAPGAGGVADPSRRRLLIDGPLAVGGIAVVGGLGAGTLTEPWALRTARYTVPIADLPPGLEGLRIVQISDTHLGPRIPAAFIGGAVARALELRPDLVLLTGDYIHNGRRYIGPAAALFRPLTAPGAVPCGVVSVLGNHDWYGDGPAMAAALAAVGVRTIDNGRVFLDAASRRISRAETPPGPDGLARCLCVAGVGDLSEDRTDLQAAIGGVGAGTPRLLLSHNPDFAESRALRGGSDRAGWEARTPARVDLMVCGHTHGGQVRVPFLGTPAIPSGYGQRYAGGLVRGPACRVLISRGVGMSLVPIRLGVPPEVVEITLTRAV